MFWILSRLLPLCCLIHSLKHASCAVHFYGNKEMQSSWLFKMTIAFLVEQKHQTKKTQPRQVYWIDRRRLNMSTNLCQLPVVSFIRATCCLKEQNNKTKQWNHLCLMQAIVSLGSCSAHRVKGQGDHRWQLLFNRVDHVEPTSHEIHSVNGTCKAYQFNFALRERRRENLQLFENSTDFWGHFPIFPGT